MGVQCKGCNKLIDGKCTRISTDGSKVGICWMQLGEGEY